MPKNMTVSVDRRALEILFATYWSGGRWCDEKSRSTPPEDFDYAKRCGVMFDPIRLSHSDIVSRAVTAVRAVERTSVADAFVVSLSSRRLDLRSALGSYAVLQHFSRHTRSRQPGACRVCGEYTRALEEVDLNVLNFERFKWGGVRHDTPLYGSFDLELFQQAPRVSLVPADVAIFKGLLDAIEHAPPETTSATLQRHLAKAFRSTKDERDIAVRILGMCGILATDEHPGYLQRFVPYSERELPGRRFVDMRYPACWWRRTDGINQDAIAYWFGHVL